MMASAYLVCLPQVFPTFWPRVVVALQVFDNDIRHGPFVVAVPEKLADLQAGDVEKCSGARTTTARMTSNSFLTLNRRRPSVSRDVFDVSCTLFTTHDPRIGWLSQRGVV